jgi:hypothetical protein
LICAENTSTSYGKWVAQIKPQSFLKCQQELQLKQKDQNEYLSEKQGMES